MKISIELQERELELISLFKEKGSLSTYDNFEKWGGTKEFKDLSKNDLIHHSNHEAEGAYIRYSLTELGELAYAQNEIKIKEYFKAKNVNKNSPAYKYKIKFEALEAKRGTPPSSWWITPYHKSNIKLHAIKEVIKTDRASYYRELAYQQELQKITRIRLKGVPRFKEGKTIKCSNDGGGYKRVTVKKITDIISVKITDGKPSVDCNGDIYYSVKYEKGKMTAHFQLNQESIILK